MISLLTSLLSNFVCWIETGLIAVANNWVSGAATAITYILGLFPPMPSLPSAPSELTQAMEWANYFFPVSFFLTLIGTIVALWVTWLVLAIPLRWLKANPDGS